MLNQIHSMKKQSLTWLLQNKHRENARQIGGEIKKIFTEHPKQTGETYFEHFCFTVKMSLHLITVSLLLFTHGLFPFLFTRTASRQIESVYLIMKSRIPKIRRDIIDEYDI
jgi:uncharacterized integral membrane protein